MEGIMTSSKTTVHNNEGVKKPSGRNIPLPPGDEVGAAELGRKVAANLHEKRKTRALSLDQLAAASGVSRAALSQIETGRSNPSLGVLWKIAVGLGIPFAELVSGADRGASILRRADTQILRSADGRLESRPLMPAGTSPLLEAYELLLAAHSTHKSEAHMPGTREVIIVLSGQLRIMVGGEMFDLGPGDSAAFPADKPHEYENRGSSESRFHDLVIYSR